MGWATPEAEHAYRKAYYAANRERIKAREAARRAAAPEHTRKLWREANKRRQERDGEARRDYLRKWYAKQPPEYFHEKALQAKYGLSVADYKHMLAAQEGRCAICGSDNPGSERKRFCVDHDHKTGRVRRLLCNDCNGGIGFFKDSPELLRKAIAYLESHGNR